MESIAFIVAENLSGQRLDKIIAENTDLSRTKAAWLIKNGHVALGGAPTAPDARCAGGDRVEVSVPPPSSRAGAPPPEDIPLSVIYEDGDFLIVDKPAGMVVHPGAGNWTGTLVSALMARGGGLSGVGGPVRPGIVHRLDKDTSGLLVVAKNDFAHRRLAEQIAAKTARRTYQAVLFGVPRARQGRVDARIGRDPRNRQKMAVVDEPAGKEAATLWRILAASRDGKFSLAEFDLLTGRTHQIRVHAAHLGHPVAGDPLYSRRATPLIGRQALHARRLALAHPRTGEIMEFSSPIPPDMAALVKQLDFVY
ncbi:pseudouridine synthase [Alphaproteobacteria bacterium]|nr:pseudouridine synthase [Alphaproteobacteria bacterium]